MFISHIPAGYIIANYYQSRTQTSLPKKVIPFTFAAILLGSILPDFDLIYFYLFDGQQHHHRTYFPHLPSFWLAALLPPLTLSIIFKKRGTAFIIVGFTLGILSHLILDSIAGGVAWLHPFSDQLHYLIKVPRLHGWWVWSFFLHWTFSLELGLFLGAAVLFVKKRTVSRHARAATTISSEPPAT